MFLALKQKEVKCEMPEWNDCVDRTVLILMCSDLVCIEAYNKQLMYNLKVIVAVVVLHQLDIRTCTAQIVHKLFWNVLMMLWSPSSFLAWWRWSQHHQNVAIKFVNYLSSACPNIELVLNSSCSQPASNCRLHFPSWHHVPWVAIPTGISISTLKLGQLEAVQRKREGRNSVASYICRSIFFCIFVYWEWPS